MRNRTGLIAAVALLFVVLGSLGFWAARRASRATEPGLSRVPRDAFLVASVDLARARVYPPASRMRWAVAHVPAVSRVLAALHAGCGFDPIDRIDAVTVAWERSALEASPNQGFSVAIDGALDRTQWWRCLDGAAQSAGGHTIALGPVAQHDAIGFVRDGSALPESLAWASPGQRGLVIAPPDGLSRALEASEGAGPSAAANERLRAALGALGGGALAFVALDVGALAQSAPQEWSSVVSGLLEGTPTASAMPALLSARSLAGAVQLTPSGLRLVISVRTDNAANAQALAAALVRWHEAGRVEFAQRVASVQGEFMTELQSAQAFEPGIAAQALPLHEAGLLLGELYDRARVRGDGNTVIAEVSLNAHDVATLENAARAALECDAALERTRPQREAAAPGGTAPQP